MLKFIPTVSASGSLVFNQMASSSKNPPIPSSDSSPERSSNRQISQTFRLPTPHFQYKDGVGSIFEKNPLAVDPFEDMDTDEYIDRFRKYEADETTRLMAKYFSDKDVYGDNIFEEFTKNGETIKASRFHAAQSYADPIQYLDAKRQKTCPPPAINEANSSAPHMSNNPNTLKGEPSAEKNTWSWE